MNARDTFLKGPAAPMASFLPAMQGHPLLPYVEYWDLRQRMQDNPRDDVIAFIDRNNDTLVGNKMRGDWIRQLARTNTWDEIPAHYARIYEPEPDVQCLFFQARLNAQDKSALKDAKALWFNGRDTPETCDTLFNTLRQAGEITDEDVWARVRLAFGTGHATLARAVAQWLPASSRPDPKTVELAARNPQKYLESKKLLLKTRAQKEIALYAVGRVASNLPDAAEDHLNRIGRSLSGNDRAYAWSLIATAGAKKLHPDAPKWFQNASSYPLNDTQLAWMARAALREQNWKEVIAALDHMSAEEKERAVWRYWRARALIKSSRQMEANAILAILANEHNFHALLAAEDLGTSMSEPPAQHKPTDDEVKQAAQRPGLQRAIAFKRLGLLYEGNLEWIWSVRGLDDESLLAAAELAKRENWWERAIGTADRTKRLVNSELRYPTPYADLLRQSSREAGLDEAWVFGLVRQESRFNPTARSSAGAAGLMQIMPSTAKWISRKLGLKEWRRSLDDAIDQNVTFGTQYLKEIFGQLDNSPVLASAGYNAGPGRARVWRGPRPLEAAIYIDTIPFTETRDYVRKVMANTHGYSRVLGATSVTFKQRLGTIRARDGTETEDP